MDIRDRCRAFLEHYMEFVPEPVTLLTYRSAFELLVAVILSAQCTDRRINGITPALFKAFPTPGHLARSRADEVFRYIRSVSYPHSKARYLVTMARQLIEIFDGRVPDRAADLQKLKGVGRKSANVVLSTLYHKPVIAVDTHVFRVSKRLGLVSKKAVTPLAVEKELMVYIPAKYRVRAHRWFIGHGRGICTALRPRCGVCPFASWCLFRNLGRHAL